MATWLMVVLVMQAASVDDGDSMPANTLQAMSLEDLLNIQVVTASGTAESAATAPANTFAVTREAIRLRGWRSVQEVLDSALGVYVVNDLVNPSVGVRGVTGGFRAGTRIVKVMIDGVEVNFRPELNALIGPEYLPIAAVERIEIAKGPLSALYGANAFLATVNVITRTPEEGLRAEASARGSYVGGAGAGATLLASYSNETHSLMLAGAFERRDRSGLAVQQTFNQDPQSAFFAPYFGRNSRDDATAPLSLFGKYELHLRNWGDLKVRSGLQQQDAVGEFQQSSLYTAKSRYALRNIWVDARHELNVNDDVKAWASVGWSTGTPADRERLFLTDNTSSSFARRFGYTAVDGSLGVTAKPFRWLTVTTGADIRQEEQQALYFTETFVDASGTFAAGDSRDRLIAGDRTQISSTNLGARLQLSSIPLPDSDALRLSADFRLDKPSFFEVQRSWRAAVAYAFRPDVVSKLIVGSAFQAPSAVLMFGIPGFGLASNIVGSRTQVAGPKLRPQQVMSVELVTSARLFDSVALQVAAFAQDVQDRIEFIQQNRNFVALNREISRSGGFEMALEVDLGLVRPFAQGSLLWHTTTSLLDPNAKELSWSALPFYPALTASGGLTFVLLDGHLEGSTGVRYVGDRAASQSNTLLNNFEPYNLGSYIRWDATLMTNVTLIDAAPTRATLSVTNILGTRISEPGFDGFDVPMLGRQIILELTQAFN